MLSVCRNENITGAFVEKSFSKTLISSLLIVFFFSIDELFFDDIFLNLERNCFKIDLCNLEMD